MTYIVILALTVAIPIKPLNIGQLLPVRAVGVYKEGNWVSIETDTGNKGYGATVAQALRNMKDTAVGVIYLDTAEYLIVTKDTEEAAEDLRRELKPSTELCMTVKQIDLAQVTEYLKIHGRLPRFRDWKMGAELPVITTFGDSIIFLKKVEKRA